MAASGGRGTAPWVTERTRPVKVRSLTFRRQRRAALGIDRGAPLDRQAVDNVVQVALDVGQLVGLQPPLEHIEATPPVGLDDLGMELARGREADRAAVAKAGGAAFAG